MIDLTIGIATCGRPRTFNRCIRSIEQNTKTPFKLLVLDNATAFTDNEKAQVNIGSRSGTILHIDRKIGCCESNNAIADECETKYLMHADDDIIVHSNIIDVMYKYIKTRNKDIVGCRWYDTSYESYRPDIKEYVIYEDKGEKKLRKFVSKGIGNSWQHTDELNHSMILNKSIYDTVRWDNNFVWKGDRVDFFLQCMKNNIEPMIYIDDYITHDPQKFMFGSIKKNQSSINAKEYFTNKWGIIPQMRWEA